METDNHLLTINKPIEEIQSIQLHSYRCTTVVTYPQLATVQSYQVIITNWSFEPDIVCDRCA